MFSSERPYPTGITGDTLSGVETSESKPSAVDLATAMRADLVAKISDGSATPEEEARFLQTLQADIAHGY